MVKPDEGVALSTGAPPVAQGTWSNQPFTSVIDNGKHPSWKPISFHVAHGGNGKAFVCIHKVLHTDLRLKDGTKITLTDWIVIDISADELRRLADALDGK